MSVKRDRLIINDIVNTYGKEDVLKYVNKIDESFEDMLAGLNNTVFKNEVEARNKETWKEDAIKRWMNEHGVSEDAYSLTYMYAIIGEDTIDLSNKKIKEFPDYINFYRVETLLLNGNLLDDSAIEHLPKQIEEYLDLSDNNLHDLYEYIGNIKGPKGLHINLAGNPNLIMEPIYLRQDLFTIDDDQINKLM